MCGYNVENQQWNSDYESFKLTIYLIEKKVVIYLFLLTKGRHLLAIGNKILSNLQTTQPEKNLALVRNYIKEKKEVDSTHKSHMV
jgi:hypothetical protein